MERVTAPNNNPGAVSRRTGGNRSNIDLPARMMEHSEHLLSRRTRRFRHQKSLPPEELGRLQQLREELPAARGELKTPDAELTDNDGGIAQQSMPDMDNPTAERTKKKRKGTKKEIN